MKKLRLGLDIGTNSIGWAVVDENNLIYSHKERPMWGVLMFDESKSAKDTRSYRNQRRRLKRRKERINLLREEFKEAIDKVDPKFFTKMNESFFLNKDRTTSDEQLFIDLFSDGDQGYRRNFKTIYHLRKYLMEETKKVDIRLVYLAIHNIIKYRGHFIIDGEFSDDATNKYIVELMKNIDETIIETKNMYEEEDWIEGAKPFFTTIKDQNSNIDDEEYYEKLVKDIRTIYKETKSKKDIKAKIKEIIGQKGGIVDKIIWNAIVSGKITINNKLEPLVDEDFEEIKIDLSSEEYDTKINEAAEVVGDLRNIILKINDLKIIRDFFEMDKFLKGERYLSEAMVKEYQKHNEQLKTLKYIVKKYASKKYNEIFRDTTTIVEDEKKRKKEKEINNYPNYIGRNNSSSKTIRKKHVEYDKFLSFIKNKLKDIEVEEEDKLIKSEIDKQIEDKEYLKRQKTSENAKFPMQLHLLELEKILNNQAKYYNLNVENIVKIFKHKIPYYIGPLYENKEGKYFNKYAWLVKNEDTKITPFNFDVVINKEETAKNFITRMLNKGTYLKGDNDYTAPKHSIYYQMFNTYQVLNKLQINGKLIDKEVKDIIYKEVMLKYEKPTKKRIEEVLNKHYGEKIEAKIPDINVSMKTYIKFKKIFNFTDREVKMNINTIEDIIKDISLFSDKKMLVNSLKKYEIIKDDKIRKLKDEEIKEIKGLNYTGFGRLSLKLLKDFEFSNIDTGEIYNGVVSVLKETNLNLQEILFSENMQTQNRYDLKTRIEEYNKNYINKNMGVEKYLDENCAVNPTSRRSLIQAIKIINEVAGILKKDNAVIDTYCIECGRVKEKNSKQTKSRYQKIKDLIGDVINKEENKGKYDYLNKELEQNQENLKKESLFLYFMQLGRCMYTGKKINVYDIMNNTNNDYDIDHIYPQSLITDNSFNNKVLVCQEANKNKTDKFLCETPYQTNMLSFWKMLVDNKLLTEKKYERLTEKEVNENKIQGFINRQIVATNQSVKALFGYLKEIKGIDEQKLIYSKALNISDFRKSFDIPKSRIANNHHHAHDAYLNATVGYAIHEQYKKNGLYKRNEKDIDGDKKKTYNPLKFFSYNDGNGNVKYKEIYNLKGELIWGKETVNKIIDTIAENQEIAISLKTIYKNDLWDKKGFETKTAKTKEKTKRKTPNGNEFEVNKYGGINSNSYNFMVIIKTKTGYELIPIPGKCKNKLENKEEFKKYILANTDIKNENFEIIEINGKILKIMFNVCIKRNKLKYYIRGVSNSGKTLSYSNLTEKQFNLENLKTIREIEKLTEKTKIVKGKKEAAEEKEKILQWLDQNELLKEERINAVLVELKNNWLKEEFEFDNKPFKKCKEELGYIVNNPGNENEEMFTKENKITLLIELLKIYKTNTAETANLKIIKLSGSSCSPTTNTKLIPGDVLYYPSPTGLYHRILYKVPKE